MIGSGMSGLGPSITWHHTMKLEDRHRVRHHIGLKVEAYFTANKRTITGDELKDRTARFETEVFEKSKSRREYLEKIAEGMAGVENRTKSNPGSGDRDQSDSVTVGNSPESNATDVGSTAGRQMSALQDKMSHLSLLTGERSAVGGGSEGANEYAPTEASSGEMMGSDINGPGPGADWHHKMKLEDRHKVCRHIMQKLEAYFAANNKPVTRDELKERTRKFEMDVYQKSKSRKEYLHKIAEGLTGIERRTGDVWRRALDPGSEENGSESNAADIGSTLETQTSALQGIRFRF